MPSKFHANVAVRADWHASCLPSKLHANLDSITILVGVSNIPYWV